MYRCYYWKAFILDTFLLLVEVLLNQYAGDENQSTKAKNEIKQGREKVFRLYCNNKKKKSKRKC